MFDRYTNEARVSGPVNIPGCFCQQDWRVAVGRPRPAARDAEADLESPGFGLRVQLDNYIAK